MRCSSASSGFHPPLFLTPDPGQAAAATTTTAAPAAAAAGAAAAAEKLQPGARRMVAIFDYDPRESSPNTDIEVGHPLLFCLCGSGAARVAGAHGLSALPGPRRS